MSTATAQIDGAVVKVEVSGCIECGVQNSAHWHGARIIGVLVGRHLLQLAAHRCDACAKPAPRQLPLLAEIGGS